MFGDRRADILQKKYNLNADPVVEFAVRRANVRAELANKLTAESGQEANVGPKKVPQNPELRIENYLNRFQEILNRKDPEYRKRGVDALKRVLHAKAVISPGEIPESYFDFQRRLDREKGLGDAPIGKERREELIGAIIADQKSSLNKWIDVLTAEDSPYPTWFKYLTLRSVVSMGDYDKKRAGFGKRAKGTVKPFPFLDSRALSLAFERCMKKVGRAKSGDDDILDDEIGEGFPDLYAYGIQKAAILFKEPLTNIEGKWVKYERGGEYVPLVETLEGQNTGWCTTSESTAKKHLRDGDFYVYYSADHNGGYTVPRAAIRMKGGSIIEVRGIEKSQNLDEYILPKVEEKLREFPDGELYKKRTRDMERLTEIDRKTSADKAAPLSREELAFLYELDADIEGFGEADDPRVEAIRGARPHENDLATLFESKQIARTLDEVTPDTKIYIGKLGPNIFRQLPQDLRYIYTTFPNGRIYCDVFSMNQHGATGESARAEILDALEQRGIEIGAGVKSAAFSEKFSSAEKEVVQFRRISLSDLGLPDGASNAQIFERAATLGLECVSRRMGLEYWIHRREPPEGASVYLGFTSTDAIAPSYVDVLKMSHYPDQVALDTYRPVQAGLIRKDAEFIFRIASSSSSAPSHS